jgi:hypothetical protein
MAVKGCQDTGGDGLPDSPLKVSAFLRLLIRFPWCARIKRLLIACVTFSARTEWGVCFPIDASIKKE